MKRLTKLRLYKYLCISIAALLSAVAFTWFQAFTIILVVLGCDAYDMFADMIRYEKKWGKMQ